MFACVECGTYQNPCRGQVIGPTLGAVLGLVVGVVAWPVGALVWVCSRSAGRSVLRAPAAAYAGISRPIPI
ncbi:MAG: hypothetical protein J3K34DRAFT_433039 [Monoraphidium minutum]|nr:MAG: hypothetical protein J3K34DRAFT_433039 [Monoraphidium minutum]